MADKKNQVQVGKAKGRPMLTWVGKKPLSSVRAWPAQHIESFSVEQPVEEHGDEQDHWADWPDKFPTGGLLFHGDNKDVLAHLLANGFRGKVKLIYIDPPFDSGADYVRKVRLRGMKGTHQLDGEEYTLGEQIQYTDIWANDNYLQFMYERLLLLKELLSEDGSLWLHCDWHKSHFLVASWMKYLEAQTYRMRLSGNEPIHTMMQKVDWAGFMTPFIGIGWIVHVVFIIGNLLQSHYRRLHYASTAW